MDRLTLKRVLRYVRTRKTELHKLYVESMGKGKTKAVQKIEGRIVTYSELGAYIEKLLKEVDEAEAAEKELDAELGLDSEE